MPVASAFQREELSLSPSHSGLRSAPLAVPDFQRDQLPLSPSPISGARDAAGQPVFQRLELPASPTPSDRAGVAPTDGATFEREELPASPVGGGGAFDGGGHALVLSQEIPVARPQMISADAAGAQVFQREELPPSPQPSEAARTVSLPRERRTGAGRTPGASAATSAPQTQPTVLGGQAQSGGHAPLSVQASQQSGQPQTGGPALPSGRSAKAIAWLQRRGKLPPMQARAHVSLR